MIRIAGSACWCGCGKKCHCLSEDSGEGQVASISKDSQLNGNVNYAMEMDIDMKKIAYMWLHI